MMLIGGSPHLSAPLSLSDIVVRPGAAVADVMLNCMVERKMVVQGMDVSSMIAT